jgi:hypothetical protein
MNFLKKEHSGIVLLELIVTISLCSIIFISFSLSNNYFNRFDKSSAHSFAKDVKLLKNLVAIYQKRGEIQLGQDAYYIFLPGIWEKHRKLENGVKLDFPNSRQTITLYPSGSLSPVKISFLKGSWQTNVTLSLRGRITIDG